MSNPTVVICPMALLRSQPQLPCGRAESRPQHQFRTFDGQRASKPCTNAQYQTKCIRRFARDRSKLGRLNESLFVRGGGLFLPPITVMVAMSMTGMHENMHQRTGKQQQIGHRAQQVRRMVPQDQVGQQG